MSEKMDNDPISRLLDPKDSDPIILYDENDNQVEFEQIALIPIEDRLYTILKPAKKMEGVADDEAIVFNFQEDDEQAPILVVEENDKVIDEVFSTYNKLLDEEEKKSSKKRVKTAKVSKRSPRHTKRGTTL